jgi:hypothetical protein
VPKIRFSVNQRTHHRQVATGVVYRRANRIFDILLFRSRDFRLLDFDHKKVQLVKQAGGKITDLDCIVSAKYNFAVKKREMDK